MLRDTKTRERAAATHSCLTFRCEPISLCADSLATTQWARLISTTRQIVFNAAATKFVVALRARVGAQWPRHIAHLCAATNRHALSGNKHTPTNRAEKQQTSITTTIIIYKPAKSRYCIPSTRVPTHLCVCPSVSARKEQQTTHANRGQHKPDSVK